MKNKKQRRPEQRQPERRIPWYSPYSIAGHPVAISDERWRVLVRPLRAKHRGHKELANYDARALVFSPDADETDAMRMAAGFVAQRWLSLYAPEDYEARWTGKASVRVGDRLYWLILRSFKGVHAIEDGERPAIHIEAKGVRQVVLQTIKAANEAWEIWRYETLYQNLKAALATRTARRRRRAPAK